MDMMNDSIVLPDLGIAKLADKTHPRCSRCHFGEKEGGTIICRRMPPQVQIIMVPAAAPRVNQLVPQVIQAWPTVAGSNWCGEFRE